MIGKTVWAIAEDYIPSESLDQSDPAFVSHETACISRREEVALLSTIAWSDG